MFLPTMIHGNISKQFSDCKGKHFLPSSLLIHISMIFHVHLIFLRVDIFSSGNHLLTMSYNTVITFTFSQKSSNNNSLSLSAIFDFQSFFVQGLQISKFYYGRIGAIFFTVLIQMIYVIILYLRQLYPESFGLICSAILLLTVLLGYFILALTISKTFWRKLDNYIYIYIYLSIYMSIYIYIYINIYYMQL